MSTTIYVAPNLSFLATTTITITFFWMWNPNYPLVSTNNYSNNIEEDDDSWEVKAFAEDTRNATGMTWPPRSYTCTFCRREFQSAQALGGHMNVHRRDRARLHHQSSQSNYNSFKNPNSPSSSSGTTLLIPSQELVASGGLCLLYSIPNPNAILSPSSLHNVQGNYYNHNPSISSLPHPKTDKFVNFPASVANSSISDSRNTKLASNHVSNYEEVVISVDKKRRRTTDSSSVAGIDLELRLGCSSLAS